MILLGFEIGTGKRVEIPDTGHLAWFGQTQLSGKTTALEAIAFRGGLRAVAFITKQGEGGFLTGRMIPPYFSEPTNDEEQPLWRWVKSILEASQQRKMNFEESWIIRACEEPDRAKTLADVHENIKSLLGGQGDYVEKGRGKKKKREWKYSRKPVSGMNAGIYTSLNAYFNIVMPQLARLPYTKKLELGPGLNVMNLQEYAMETQALVIRSVMEWVYQHEKNVRIIVPEAQDFVPQGKNSPVKMACETLVRKAGANKNFMWLDSQDMAAVDKFALRACSIVGIGVQTEMHEIDRSLATMFTPTLKAVDIARLKIGEFFVRTSEARVSKCYVQPAWMDSELHAQAIAKGEESVSSARQMLSAFKASHKTEFITEGVIPASGTKMVFGRGKSIKQVPSSLYAETVSGEARVLVPDGKTLRGEAAQGKPHQLLQIQTQDSPGEGDLKGEEHETKNTSAANRGIGQGTGIVESTIENRSSVDSVSGTPVRAHPADGQGPPESEVDEKMWREKYETLEFTHKTLIQQYDQMFVAKKELEAEHKSLIEAHDALAERVRAFEQYEFESGADIPDADPKVAARRAKAVSSGNGTSLTQAQEEIYRYVISRAEKDPGVLELLTRRPELRVKVERPTVSLDDSTIIGRIARLIHDGYFSAPKNGPTVQKELKRRGCDQPTTNLYKPLNRLTEIGFLTLEPDGYQSVPGMKVQEENT
jgi:hypothetical protein